MAYGKTTPSCDSLSRYSNRPSIPWTVILLFPPQCSTFVVTPKSVANSQVQKAEGQTFIALDPFAHTHTPPPHTPTHTQKLDRISPSGI